MNSTQCLVASTLLIQLVACNGRAPASDYANKVGSDRATIVTSSDSVDVPTPLRSTAPEIAVGSDFRNADSVVETIRVKPLPSRSSPAPHFVSRSHAPRRIHFLTKHPKLLAKHNQNAARRKKTRHKHFVAQASAAHRRRVQASLPLQAALNRAEMRQSSAGTVNPNTIENLSGARYEGSKARTKADAPGAENRAMQAR